MRRCTAPSKAAATASAASPPFAAMPALPPSSRTFFSGLSIRHKLTLISIVPTMTLLLASAAFVGYDYVAVRTSQIRSDETLADLIAARSAVPISAGDEAAATAILSALVRDAHVTKAYVVSAEGQVLARYAQAGAADTTSPHGANQHG